MSSVNSDLHWWRNQILSVNAGFDQLSPIAEKRGNLAKNGWKSFKGRMRICLGLQGFLTKISSVILKISNLCPISKPYLIQVLLEFPGQHFFNFASKISRTSLSFKFFLRNPLNFELFYFEVNVYINRQFFQFSALN